MSYSEEEKKKIDEVFPDSPHQPTLSQAINTSTKDLHDDINMMIMARFGECLKLGDYRLYREGIVSYYHIYNAFERTWAALMSDPTSMPSHVYEALCIISDPRLTRTSAIAADLQYFYDNNFEPEAPTSRPQVAAYVKHIENKLREKPHIIVAYAHVYYMALFAGGKILRKMLEQRKGFLPIHSPAADEDQARRYATNMFAFPIEAGKEEIIRAKFKGGMEVIQETLTEEEKTDIIQESRAIFEWNGVLARELDVICAPLAAQAVASKAGRVMFETTKAQYDKFAIAFVGILALWSLYVAKEIFFS